MENSKILDEKIKKADNKILDINKEKLHVEEEIYNLKDNIEKIDEVDESFYILRERLSRCNYLLEHAVIGKQNSIIAQEFEKESNFHFLKLKNIFDNKRNELNTILREGYNKKDELNEDIKKLQIEIANKNI